MEAFEYNPRKNNYPGGGVYSLKKDIMLTSMNILWNDKGDYFLAKFPHIFEKYTVTIKNKEDESAWKDNPMQFWQSQLHFAIWCATSGCGVSFRNHLSSSNALTKSLFYFHVYYQTRRILDEIKCPLPQDPSFNANNNNYDRMAYERICSEFNIPISTNWHPRGPNNGMGKIYIFNYRYHTDKSYSEYTGDHRKLTFEKIPPVKWVSNPNIFSSNKGHWVYPYQKQIHHIEQPSIKYWKSFILDKSEGFTKAGVVRINDSIRTYVWALLGSQAQTRTSITNNVSAFGVQKQFIMNVEDAISSPVDLPSSIKRYQNVLEDASSKLDYVFGIGLYMAPSNMKLRIDTEKGYNNKIMIADTKRILGVNSEINNTPEIFAINESVNDSVKKPLHKPDLKRPEVTSRNNNLKYIITIVGIFSGIFILWK